jgi:ATP-dependent DNA helicase RecQ
LINQGLCEIAFHQQNKIRLTSLAREVLEGDKVQLTTVQKINGENRTERDQKQICSNSLLKHSGDYVMQFLKTKMFLPM